MNLDQMMQQVVSEQADYAEDRDEEDEDEEDPIASVTFGGQDQAQVSTNELHYIQNAQRDFLIELYGEQRLDIVYWIMSAYGDKRFRDENQKKISNEIDIAFASSGLTLDDEKKRDLIGLVSALLILETQRSKTK